MATDDEIIDLYLGRDERAIQETSEKYGSRLHYLSRQIVGDERTAEECVNDTWLKTWLSIPPSEPRDYLYAFVARITRMLSLDRYRKENAKKRRAHIVAIEGELGECVAGPDTTQQWIDEIMLKEALNRFLESLSAEKRDVFIRRYWYADELKAIAKRHGCSEGRIKSMLMRLRMKLKSYLQTEGIEI